MIDIVNKFAVSIMATIIERDFKSEYLFCMSSVVTNLVPILEFGPFHCTTTLCHFGRTGNGYVAIHLIVLSSTAESSATGG